MIGYGFAGMFRKLYISRVNILNQLWFRRFVPRLSHCDALSSELDLRQSVRCTSQEQGRAAAGQTVNDISLVIFLCLTSFQSALLLDRGLCSVSHLDSTIWYSTDDVLRFVYEVRLRSLLSPKTIMNQLFTYSGSRRYVNAEILVQFILNQIPNI